MCIRLQECISHTTIEEKRNGDFGGSSREVVIRRIYWIDVHFSSLDFSCDETASINSVPGVSLE
jgi:hypothetical protein